MTSAALPLATVRARTERFGLAVAALLLSILAGAFVGDPWLLRVALAGSVLAVIVAAAIRKPDALLLGLSGWLVVLALSRRLLSGVLPSTTIDPLLLIGPVALVLLAVVARDRGAFQNRTPLATAVLVYTVLTVVGVLNPLQGNLVGGVSALLFFTPLVAFWIGRSLGDVVMRRLLLMLAWLAIPAAGYGLLQVFRGFPVWDAAWIERIGVSSLSVNGATRPFASFSSPGEYGFFLAIGTVIWLAFARRGTRVAAAAVAVLLTVGLVHVASRGLVVMLLIAAALMFGARHRLSLPASLAAGTALLLLLPMTVGRLAPTTADDSSSRLIARQTEGLANPLDSESSTARIHADMVVNGMRFAFREPLGLGPGAVTIAGSKFGGRSRGAEADPGNAAVSLGLPGLLTYLALVGFGYMTVFRVAQRRRDGLALAALGILTVTLLQWLNGGMYAVAFLPWLVLGWADRDRALALRPDDEEAP
jgi:hypothetical protein